MARQRIRVLVVGGHSLARKGIVGLLHGAEDLEIVGEAGDGREGVDRAASLAPDVILMDLVMPGTGGVETLREIREPRPGTAIVVFTAGNREDEIRAAVRAGALGCLAQTAARDEVIEALRRVHRGEPALPPGVTRKLLGHAPANARVVVAEALTESELRVLGLVARGLENPRIGERLHVSEATVRTHVRNMLAKLGLANRVELVLHALSEGWTSLDEYREEMRATLPADHPDGPARHQ